MPSSELRSRGDGAPEDEAVLERLVRAEQLETLYRKGLIALCANLVNSAILVAALWSVVPHRRMVVWIGLVYALVGVRLVGWDRHRRANDAVYDSGRWERGWLVGTFATGLLWGLAGAVFSPTDSLGTQYLVLFLIAGMVAGASASMSSFMPAFLAFTVPALVPPFVRLCLAQGGMHLVMALLVAAFGVGMTAVATSGSHTFEESIRLRFRNVLLAQDLTAAQEELSAINNELAQRIADRTKELEQAIAERDRFVSVVSHELKSPLSSMTLNESLLSRAICRAPAPDLTELQRLFDILTRQTARMRRLVDDLLDVSRLATERMRYEKNLVDLKGIIVPMLDELAPQLRATGGSASFTVDVEDGLRGNWDPGRLQQVFTNLITNAIRYGAAPYALSARRVGDSAEVVVRDSGRGIPPEDLNRIFQASESAHPMASTPGLGLGLYIADQIVRAHAGSMRAESTPGHGATFIVRLPLASA